MAVYTKIDLHFAGLFTRYPMISYSDGVEQRFEDVDFAGMDKKQIFSVHSEIRKRDMC